MEPVSQLREWVELLVRPSRRIVVPGGVEDRVFQQVGVGTGRIGKDEVTCVPRLREVTQRAAAAGQLPLLLSVNQEGGRLNALDWAGVAQLPGNLALGAGADDSLAEAAGVAIGGQLRAVGVTWNLAPVCDLADWPSAPAVGTRSFGCDPDRVARLAAGFVRGLQSVGVAATAKHFPGLGGASADPHHVMPVQAQLAPDALVPFQAVIDAGVASVMVGSQVVAELDDCPAVLSSTVIGLLRGELGFAGVVVSENLSIPAVHEPVGGLVDAAVAALAAGIDVVMLDSEVSRGRSPLQARCAAAQARRDVVGSLVAAVGDVIDPDHVQAAAGRVRRMHDRFGVRGDQELADWDSVNQRADAAADDIATRAVTVLRGADHLPLALTDRSVLAAVRIDPVGEPRADSARYAPDLIGEALRAWCPNVVQLHREERALPPGVTAVVVYGYDTGPTSVAGTTTSRAAVAAARWAGRGVLVVQIALGIPDDLDRSPADVLVAGFSPHRASVTAIAAALFGHGRAPGILPLRGPTW